MKIEVRVDKRGVPWVKVTTEADFGVYGGGKVPVVEEFLIGEAQRLHEALGKAIKRIEQIQRPGVRKIGDY